MDGDNSLGGCVSDRVVKDAFGHELKYAVSIWNGRQLAHSNHFRNIPAVLQSLKTYQPRSDDIWKLSYPKSGQHWLHEIISMLISGSIQPVPTVTEANFLEVAKDIDDIVPINSRRFYSTHIWPEFLPPGIFPGCKVVVIIRNPLSVALSYYHHYTKSVQTELPYTGTSLEFITSFLHGKNPGFGDNYQEGLFKSWFDFNKSMWDMHQTHPDTVHVMFYEELKKNPVAHIQALGQFLGTEYPIETYQKIAELTQLDNLKTSAKNKTCSVLPQELLSQLLPMFYRKGLTDEWKEHMSDDDFTEFFLYFHDQLKDYPDLRDRIRFE